MYRHLIILFVTIVSFGFAQNLTHISNRFPTGEKSAVNVADDIFEFDSTRKSFIQEQSEYYNSLNITGEEYYNINIPAVMDHSNSRSACNLNKMVFGWHPYWQNGFEANYDWDLISDFCYFNYDVDPATGNATSTHNWATANSVDTALARGLKVHLCVTLFSDHATLFSCPTAPPLLITSLVY